MPPTIPTSQRGAWNFASSANSADPIGIDARRDDDESPPSGSAAAPRSPPLRSQEVQHEAGEGVRHLVHDGDRAPVDAARHGSPGCAGPPPRPAGRERVLGPPRDERRAADPADLLLHPVPAAGAVTLPDLLARPERVGDEPRQEIRPLLRIEAAAGSARARPCGCRPASARRGRRGVRPSAGAGRDRPSRRTGTRRGRAARPGPERRRQLHRDDRARVVPDHGRRPDAQAVEQRGRPARVVLDVAARRPACTTRRSRSCPWRSPAAPARGCGMTSRYSSHERGVW